MRGSGRGLRRALRIALCGLISVVGAPSVPIFGAQSHHNDVVRLTVEINWTGRVRAKTREIGDAAIEMSLSAGRIVAVQARTPGTTGPLDRATLITRPKAEAEQVWLLGTKDKGQARARLELPLSAEILIRAGGRLTRFPVLALIDGPQRTPGDAPMDVVIQRLRWDPIEIDLEQGDGIAAPGAEIPVLLGFNVLSADPADVGVQYSAELKSPRTGQVHWRHDARPEAVMTDTLDLPRKRLVVTMPKAAGTYILEVRANWEPLSSFEASPIGRLFKRRKGGPSGVVTRRVSLVVFDPVAPDGDLNAQAQGGSVDQVDLQRAYAGRPTISGRAAIPSEATAAWPVPAEALVEPRLRDKLRGWINRSDDHTLLPADDDGRAWMAFELRTSRPGRPHRLSLTCSTPPGVAPGVALVVPESPGVRPRILLDAMASATPASDATQTFQWIVWPDQAAPLLLVYNPSTRGSITVRSVELAEVTGGLGPPPDPTTTAAPGVRITALHVADSRDVDRFGAWIDGAGMLDRMAFAQRQRDYARACGAETIIVPEALADRDARRALDGQGDEDPIGADGLELLLRTAEASRLSLVLEIDSDRALQRLPAPGSEEGRRLGLARVDVRGVAELDVFQLLRPEVQKAFATHLQQCLEPRARHTNLTGLLIRLGPGSTLLGRPETGLDDQTYAEFVAAKFPADEASRIPGLDRAQADRFLKRVQFTTGPGQSAWLEWRAERLGQTYAELAAAVRQAAPGAVLAVVTPALDTGIAGAEARRSDLQGESPDQAWLALGLDLKRWPRGPAAPLVLRGVSLSSDPLAHDLGSSPELDRAVITCPARGLWLGRESEIGVSRPLLLSAAAEPVEPALGHAMAVLDPGLVVITTSVASGREPVLSQFNRVFRALPPPDTGHAPPAPLASGVAIRTFGADGRTFMAVANDTPYEVLQPAIVRAPTKTPIDDLGRGARLEPIEAPGGGQSLVLRLPPFGVAAVRVAAPDVPIEPGSTYFPAMAAIEDQAENLSVRLGQAEAFLGPPTPDFEPAERPQGGRARVVQIGAQTEPDALTEAVRGWSSASTAPGRVAIDLKNPHEGRGALRFEAEGKAAALVSDEFLPPGGTTLSLRLWMRSDRDQAQIRVQVEGEEAGRRFARHVDLPIGLEWAECTVRIPNLPAEGVDSMRLRFTWLDSRPGVLWLDSLALTGGGPSEPGRRTHRLLMEAVQAYRAKRYADFARLIGSRRARHVLPDIAPDAPAAVRTGQASDLPANRRLR